MRRHSRYLLYLFLTLSGFALLTKIFTVKQVNITGNVLTNEGHIRRIIVQPNLLWTDLNQLAQKIAKDNFIDIVTISVKGPSTINVKVDELKPIVNLDLNGALLQIAANGTILTVGDTIEAPTIRGVEIFPFLPGNRIPREYILYLQLVEAVKELGLTEIILSTTGTTLKLGNKCEVFLGQELEDPQIIRQKLKEITMRGQEHKYIDLSQKGYARGL